MKSNSNNSFLSVAALACIIFCSAAPLTNANAADYALAFNGSQVVGIPHLAAQDGYPFTVMCWFMEPTNSPGGGALVGNYVSGQRVGWQIAIDSQLYAWYWYDPADYVGRTGSVAVKDGLWHHVAFVVNSTGGVLYLDGVPKQTNTWAGVPGACTTTENVFLGIYQGDSLYTGDIDEVSIWNVALTPSQIQTYMHLPLQGTETGLVDYYRMNEGSGTNIYDSTANADTGILSFPNSPTWILTGALIDAPQVATLPATVSVSSATLNGTINPEGENSGSWFNWGLTTNYGNATAVNTTAAAYTNLTIAETLSGLSGAYHFQIVATNASGTNYGADQSVDIQGPPQVATLPATVSANSATLSGTVDSEGQNTGSWFRWGLTTGYGNVTATNSFPAGYTISTNMSTLSGLAPATYHFQIVAINVNGTNYGVDQSFNIVGPPQVATLSATVTANSALLSGTVDPEGENTGCWLNWGLTTSYGNVTAMNTFAAGYSNFTITNVLSGLFPGTYHFQMVATNASGTNFGADQMFTITEQFQFQLGTSNLVTGPAIGTDSVILATSATNASWAVTPNAPWLHVPPPYPASGVGSTNIIFTIDANTGATRSGTISIVDQTMTVTQAGSNYVAAPEPATVLATAGLIEPSDVAVDGAGNAYVSDYGAGIVEWVKTNSTLKTLASGIYAPSSIAVDKNSNVYFSDTYSNAILEWVAASGRVVALVNSGLNNPEAVAVDSAGNVYIVDSGNDAIKEWVAATSNVVTLVSSSSGLGYPEGVAVDIAGNVYISDPGSGVIDRWTAAGGLTRLAGFAPNSHPALNLAVDGSGNVFFANYPDLGTSSGISEWSAVNKTVKEAVSNDLNGPYGVAVDSAGNIYIPDYGNAALKEFPHAFLDPSGRAEPYIAGSDTLGAALPTNALQFAPFVPTSDQSWLTVTGVTNGMPCFSFVTNATGLPHVAQINVLGESIDVSQSAVVLGTANLLEGPAAGADSVNLAVPPPIIPLTASANSGWLHLAGGYQPNADGTNVIFTFDANLGATRVGTITIGSQTLTVTQAGAPYVPAPAPLTTLISNGIGFPSSTYYATSLAVDNAGNVYIADPGNHAIKEWVAASNLVTTITSDLERPTGLALDKVDNLLFIADAGSHTIYLCGLPDSRLIPLVTSGLYSPSSIGVDSFDNVYIGDTGDNTIKRWNIDDGSISMLVSNVDNLAGMTVDNAGDVYFSATFIISGTFDFRIMEWVAGTGNLVTRLSEVDGPVAVDGSGNIYSGFGSGIEKWTAVTGNSATLVSGWFIAVDVYLDNAGNLYIADSYNGAVEELPRAYVDPTAKMEPYPGGGDALPPVLPASANLLPPFAPTTDQPWLSVANTANGLVDFIFTANIGSLLPRTGHITVLGESVPVTQTNAPVTPANLTGARMLGNGSFQFTFTNTPGTTFTVLATTNLALPLTNWVEVGTVSNISPGIYQFMTTQPLTNLQEFYQVIWP